MRAAIERHDQLMTTGIVGRKGIVLTERGEGDSFFAVFKRAADAVAAAIAVQRSLDFESWPSKLPIRVRMAIHSGDVDEEYRGAVVNRCARLRGLARGAQVLLSAPTHDLVMDNLPAGVEMRELGSQRLRDLSRPERVFELIDTKLSGSRQQGVRPRWSRTVKLAASGGLAVAVVAIAALAFALLSPSRQAPAPGGPTITTVAGLGSAGDSGDNGPATAAQLYRPSGIAVDKSGNLFIADRQRIRQINVATGMITGTAGSGGSGYSGDNGPAAQAQMHGAWAIAVDSLGNVYVAEKGNNVIRRVSPDGMIATVAGSGAEGFVGDGGPAVQARLNAPQGVAVDAAGNLYIADAGNNRIRRVAHDGTITTIAGTGDAGFAGDGGPAALARLNGPRGLAIDPSGALLIADYGNHRVRKINAGNPVISTIAGTGKDGFSGDGGLAVNAQLNFPSGVATDGVGNVYVADTSNNRIRKVATTNGTISTVVGNGSRGFSGDKGPATAAGLNLPVSVAVDAKGDVYVADTTNRRIRHVAGSAQAPASHQPAGLPGQP
jgi:sugar lactone lactonase YvrE